MNPTDSELRGMLEHARTIAVVGLSDKPDRDSHQIAQYLQSQGYRIIPVNPMVPAVLGETSYASLSEIPQEVRIDIVDIFRRSEQVLPVVDEALIRGVGAIWMQLGIRNAEAAQRAAAAKVPVIEDLCIMVQHRRLGLHRPSVPRSQTPGPRTG
ncbi:MAG: CoA-binding protein [Thermoplasmata archaeon]|nr:CoA-binding protein [Thermoplasmata archaeon]